MEDELALMGCLYGPGFLPQKYIALCKDYRDAVRLSWVARRSKGMTQRTLAERAELYASHVSEYLEMSSINKKGGKYRSLPADKIDAFEGAVGNKVITQWKAYTAGLTIMEEVLEQRKIA